MSPDFTIKFRTYAGIAGEIRRLSSELAELVIQGEGAYKDMLALLGAMNMDSKKRLREIETSFFSIASSDYASLMLDRDELNFFLSHLLQQC